MSQLDQSTGEVDVSIAAAPCDIESVPGLIENISALRGRDDLGHNRDARLYLLDQARQLVRALESPRETMLKHVGAETSSFFSIALGVDVGLFKALAQNNGSPKKSAEIASAIGFDVDGLRRILRHQAAMGHIIQTGPDEYAPNNFSKALTIPIVADGYPFYRSVCIAPMLHLHNWLKTKSYQTPTTGFDNPFTFGNQTALTMFEYMGTTPQYMEQFNNHMGGYRLGRPAWLHPSVYPVQQNLLSGISNDGATLVDIGGNRGHDLERFLSAFPNAPGPFILQDQQAVLDEAPSALDSRIQKMSHDFFTPQPVKGARAYYLHHILHDWPDDKCETIVKQIKSAMKPGYSKLLINEHVIPSVGANWEATYLDLYMMILFGSRERTEDDWRVLLEEKCGVKIVSIWNPGNGVEGIIECEV